MLRNDQIKAPEWDEQAHTPPSTKGEAMPSFSIEGVCSLLVKKNNNLLEKASQV